MGVGLLIRTAFHFCLRIFLYSVNNLIKSSKGIITQRCLAKAVELGAGFKLQNASMPRIDN